MGHPALTLTLAQRDALSPTPEAIRQARRAAGLTQSEAAMLIHAKLRSWQDWETGRRKMHMAFWNLFQVKTLG